MPRTLLHPTLAFRVPVAVPLSPLPPCALCDCASVHIFAGLLLMPGLCLGLETKLCNIPALTELTIFILKTPSPVCIICPQRTPRKHHHAATLGPPPAGPQGLLWGAGAHRHPTAPYSNHPLPRFSGLEHFSSWWKLWVFLSSQAGPLSTSRGPWGWGQRREGVEGGCEGGDNLFLGEPTTS